MTTKAASTRRAFIRKTGAALSVPLAAVGATLPATVGAEADPLAARLALLEDLDAIRALNQVFAREVNLIAADFGQRDVIEVAPDRRTATGLMHGSREIETVIGPSCPLVEMAREQGGGVVRRAETGAYEIEYVRSAEGWAVSRATFRAQS